MALSTGDGDHGPACDEPMCAGCTLDDDGPELASWLMFEAIQMITGATAREQHLPWFCSECACFRCSAWTPEGGGRCCWCGVFLAMP